MTEKATLPLPPTTDPVIQTAGLVNLVEQRMREHKAAGRPYASMVTELLATPCDPQTAAVVAQALKNVLSA